MKIALFHNLPSGGAKRAVFETVRRLAQRHVVDVYTLSTADHSFCDIRPFVHQHHIFDFAPHRLFETPWGRLNRLQRWRDLSRLTSIGHRIAQKINMGSYDVVFAHPCRYTFIPTLLFQLQIASVYYLHEPVGRTFTRQLGRPYCQKRNSKWRDMLDYFDPLLIFYNRRVDNICYKGIKRTTQLLANSKFTRQQMSVAYNIDAPVCHLGVDSEDFQPVSGIRKENCVISVGEMTPRKGFDFLIKSLARLPADKRPKLKLVSNSENPAERRYIQELATDYNVKLLMPTNLDTQQLAIEYNKAILCVYAPVREPFGLVPLEAMACGAPVVGVAEGGVRETVVDGVTGRLVDRDPLKFAEAVRSLLEDPDLRQRYGQQAREYVLKEWTWDRAVARIEHHLCNTAGRNCP